MLGNNNFQERRQELEWEVFCSQMKKEIRMSTKVQVSGSSLILTEDVGTVVYEQYENVLRRRVNLTGHEVLLQNISNVNFTLLKNSINVAIKDLNGKDYTVMVYSFLNWSGA
jgi:competence protein ComGF